MANPAPPDDADLEALQEKLKQERARRSAALQRLKATVQKSVDDVGCPLTPSREFKMAQQNPEMTPDPDALEAAQEERKRGLLELKKTTVEAVRVVRETALMDPRQLAARLQRRDEEGSGTGATLAAAPPKSP